MGKSTAWANKAQERVSKRYAARKAKRAQYSSKTDESPGLARRRSLRISTRSKTYGRTVRKKTRGK